MVPPADAGVDLWGLFTRHLRLLVAAVLIAAGASYVYSEQQVPTYESMGRMVVAHAGPNALPVRGTEVAGVEDILSTQALLIRSPVIVQIAVEKGDLGRLSSLAGAGDPIRAIVARLAVKPTDLNANVLDVSFRGPHAGDCATVVNAVMAAYRDYLSAAQHTVHTETMSMIAEAKDVLLEQLQTKEDEYRRFRQSSPLLFKGEERTNIHHARLAEIEASRAQLVLARSELTSLLESVEAAMERGDNREALLLMMERVKGSAGKLIEERSLQGDIVPLLLEEAVLLQDLGPEHPKVVTIRKRIEMTRSLYNLPETATGVPPSARSRSNDFVYIYLESLRRQVAATEQREAELNALFNKERESAKALMDIEMQDEAYRNDLGRLRQLFDAVVKRLQELSLFKDNEGYKAQVISSAEWGWQVEPNFFRIMVMGCVVGLFAGVAAAYLLELGDKSFKTPDEISQALNLQILGHISKITVSQKAYQAASCRLHSTLVTYYEARSRAAEAFRAIRTALSFLVFQHKYKTLQVTSPGPGDGKSTIVGNLAISFAHAGKKVLVIEADLRRPTVHELFGVDPTRGTTNVLDGSMEPQDVIQETDAHNLWVIPCGYLPENPAELLSHSRFREMLEVLAPKYDFILIDSPPLLAVSDAAILTHCVDGVLLALRLDKKSRNSAQRAREMLAMYHANVLGVVVNFGDTVSSHSYSRHYARDSGGDASYYYHEKGSVAVPLRIEQQAPPATVRSSPGTSG
jgi:capsular exopolysaccharide synthesis family protein